MSETDIRERKAEAGEMEPSLVQRLGGRKFIVVMTMINSAVGLALWWGPGEVQAIKDLILALLASVGVYLSVNAATNGNGGAK